MRNIKRNSIAFLAYLLSPFVFLFFFLKTFIECLYYFPSMVRYFRCQRVALAQAVEFERDVILKESD